MKWSVGDASVRSDSRQFACGSHKSPDSKFISMRQKRHWKWSSPWRSEVFITFKISLCNTRNCNFILALRNSRAFPVSIFTKITSTQQYYLKISYTEFYPDRSTNVVSKDGNSFTPCNKIVPPLCQLSRYKIVPPLCRFSRNKIVPPLCRFSRYKIVPPLCRFSRNS